MNGGYASFETGKVSLLWGTPHYRGPCLCPVLSAYLMLVNDIFTSLVHSDSQKAGFQPLTTGGPSGDYGNIIATNHKTRSQSTDPRAGHPGATTIPNFMVLDEGFCCVPEP